MIIEEAHVKRDKKYWLAQQRQVYYKAEGYKGILEKRTQVLGYLVSSQRAT